MLPRNEQSNARRVASGDHLGEPAMQSALVNWTRFEPSRLHDQIWSCPERADARATLLPSGEKSGSSSSRVDGARGLVRQRRNSVGKLGPGCTHSSLSSLADTQVELA